MTLEETKERKKNCKLISDDYNLSVDYQYNILLCKLKIIIINKHAKA